MGWRVVERARPGGGWREGALVDALLLVLGAVEFGARLERAEVAAVPEQCVGHLVV